jgi:hypothetical protein
VLLPASVLQLDVPRTLARQPRVLDEADHESERRPIPDLNALMKTDNNTSEVCGTDHLHLSKHRAALCERDICHRPARTEWQKAGSEFSPEYRISYIPRCRVSAS